MLSRFVRPRLIEQCRATHASGLHCTLAPGHDGDHVAQTIDVRDVLKWSPRAPGFESFIPIEPDAKELS